MKWKVFVIQQLWEVSGAEVTPMTFTKVPFTH